MSGRIGLQRLIEVVDGDRELVTRLVEEGLIENRSDGFSHYEVQRVLVSRTLIRELDVNWEAVEIILRLREDLLESRRQVAELFALLKNRLAEP